MRTKKVHILFILMMVAFSATAQKLSVQTGHSGSVKALAFHPNGNMLASAGIDQNIILWDLRTSKQMSILSGHTGAVNALRFLDRDSTVLVSVSDDHTMRLWNIETGQEVFRKTFDEPLKSMDISSNQRMIALGGKFVYYILAARLYRPDTLKHNGKCLRARDEFTSVAFSSQGYKLACGGKRERKVTVFQWTPVGYVKERSYRMKANELSFSPVEGMRIGDDSIPPNRYLYVAGVAGKLGRFDLLGKFRFRNYRIANLKRSLAYNSVVFDRASGYFCGGSKDNMVHVFSGDDGKTIARFAGHHDDINALAISPKGNYLASSGHDRYIVVWNLKTQSVSRVLSGVGNTINDISFDPSGHHMFIAYEDGGFRMWDLMNHNNMRYHEAPANNFYKGTNKWSYSVAGSLPTLTDGKVFVKARLNYRDEVTDEITRSREDLLVWNTYFNSDSIRNDITDIKRSKNTTETEFLTLTDSVMARYVVYATHPPQRALLNTFRYHAPARAIFKTYVDIVPLENIRRRRFIMRNRIVLQGDLVQSSVSKNGTYISALFYQSDSLSRLEIRNAKDNKLLRNISLTETGYSYTGFSDNERLFYLVNELKKKIEVYDMHSLEYRYSLKGSMPVTFSNDCRHLCFIGENNELVMANANNGRILGRVRTKHSGRIADISFNPTKGFIATAGQDGLVKLWDTIPADYGKVKLKHKLNLAAFNEKDFIMITPDNYYFATQGALRKVGFSIKNTMYAFEQFDVLFNRPDTVLQMLGFLPTESINELRSAVLKRKRKMGNALVNAGTSGIQDLQLPEINATFPQGFTPETEQDTLYLLAKGLDKGTTLQKLNVWVNGVPIYGKAGLPLGHLATNYWQGTIAVPLTYGINKVQVTAVNRNGLESLPFESLVSKVGAAPTPTTYIVAIGAKEYADQSKNLNYPAKDVRDLIEMFTYGHQQTKLNLRKTRNPYLVVDTFINENVIVTDILAVKQQLLKSKVNDRVILFYAGHGLLDRNFDYYLATYDIDFGRPAQKGLSYEAFEDLLDSIPARNKLLIMDACHSGEIDKEEVVRIAKESTLSGKRMFRSASGAYANKTNAFQLMKSIFADIRRGTGATVISSSAGTQYAQESKEWANGAFTLCLKNGLSKNRADLNSDGDIYLAELQKFLEKEVQRLTNGQQKPDSRVKNFDLDFVIW